MIRTAWIVPAAMLLAAGPAMAGTGSKRPAAQLQIGGALGLSAPPGRPEAAPGEGGNGEEREPGPPLLVRLLNPDQDALTRDRDNRQGAGFAYPVARAVSLKVGYRFLDAEDLGGVVTAVGAIDSDHRSHRFLLRASWYFQF